jgi:hypothetical protein
LRAIAATTLVLAFCSCQNVPLCPRSPPEAVTAAGVEAPIRSVTVDVDTAVEGWQPTGIVLAAGDVAVLVVGSGPVDVGLGRRATCCDITVVDGTASFAPGALKLRIGDRARWDWWGVSPEHAIVGGPWWGVGELQLQVYDNDYTDNHGVHRVSILYVPGRLTGWVFGVPSRRR